MAQRPSSAWVFVVVAAVVAVVLASGTAVVAQTPSATPFSSPSVSPSTNWGRSFSGTLYSGIARNLEGTGSGPAAYYRLSDLPIYRNRLTDDTGNAHGTIYGVSSGLTTLRTTGDYAVEDFGIHFRLGGYAEAPVPTGFGGSASGLAFEGWFRVDSLNSTFSRTLFSLSTCTLTFSVSLVNDRISVAAGSSVQWSNSAAISTGGFHLVQVLFRPSSSNYIVELYVDGQLQSDSKSITQLSFAVGSTCVFRIGESADNVWIDEVALYNQALSTNDILSRWSSGSQGSCRRRPCFTGVRCEASGTNSYSCGPCPDGFTGDGRHCTPTGTFKTRIQCDPPPSQATNISWCPSRCHSFQRCMECGLRQQLTSHLQVRMLCAQKKASGQLPELRTIISTSTAACGTAVYAYTGYPQVYVVPAGVSKISAFIWGAGGAGGSASFNGGAGGFTYATLTVTPGDIFYVVVGEGGRVNSSTTSFGGGGSGAPNGAGSSGGGLSGLFRSSVLFGNAVAVAGGGGGAGFSRSVVTGATAGPGGSSAGQAGTTTPTGHSGGGGSLSSGGASSSSGASGSPLSGGSGAILADGGGGGGGGGGYYGGGGGVAAGGGSGFVGVGVTGSALRGTGVTPPFTYFNRYAAGVGVGGSAGLSGGNGRVVIVASAACQCISGLQTCRCAFSSWPQADGSCVSTGSSCKTIRTGWSGALDGTYSITMGVQSSPYTVSCDMTTAGGGWTVFQRRQDGSVNFYQTYASYATGFGDLLNEHWLSSNLIASLTAWRSSSLRVDLRFYPDATSTQYFASYSSFSVGNAATGYRLSVSGYSGDAGDSLSGHSGYSFTTYDVDQDSWSSNCAISFHGAWWYTNCHSSNLNGGYAAGPVPSYADTITWSSLTTYYQSAGFVEMKLREN